MLLVIVSSYLLDGSTITLVSVAVVGCVLVLAPRSTRTSTVAVSSRAGGHAVVAGSGQ